jgi:hypothetical protein
MAANNLVIANMALARLGEPNITAFASGNNTAGKVNDLYEMVVLNLLSMYRWRFARRRASLTLDATFTPVNEWTNGFSLPTYQTDLVGQIIKVYSSTSVGAVPHTNYELQARHVLTNETVCVVEYTNRKAEAVWPGYFEALVVEALAATLALPVAENQGKEGHHTAKAFGSPGQNGRGGMFQSAVQSDLLGSPTESLLDAHDPMTAARFGGY